MESSNFPQFFRSVSLLVLFLTLPLSTHAELQLVETTAWTDPGGMGKEYIIRYTIDTDTGKKHGRHEEIWRTAGTLKYEANYVQGVLDGVEVAYASGWVDQEDTITTTWNMGTKLRVEYSGKFWDGTLSHQGTEVYSGDYMHAEHTYYHENGQVFIDQKWDHHVSAGLTTFNEIRTYADNGNLTEECWRRTVIDETGVRSIYMGPWRKRFFDDGKPRSYAEYNDHGEYHGVVRQYDWDGNLQRETNYKNGVKEGIEYHYSTSGALTYYETFVNGIRHGLKENFFETGELSGRSYFSNNQQCGTATTYYKDGTVYQEFHYNDCAPLEGDDEFDETADPDETHVLAGTVTDRVTGIPLGGVTVTAGSYTTLTGVGGSFRLDLGSGSFHTLSLSRDGYITRTGNLDMSGYQERHIRVRLLPLGSDDKPAVVDVESSNGDVFFAGLGATTTYTAELNWGEGSGESVTIGGRPAALASSTASLSFNMDSLSPSLTAQTLDVVATNVAGVQSDPYRLQTVVVPQPTWLKALGALSPGTQGDDLDYMTFKLSRQWPQEPVSLALTEENLGSYAWAAWQVVPLVGGQNFGLNAVQALLDAEFKTDGNGNILLGGQAGVTAGGQSISGKLGGKGYFSYRPSKGVTWNKGSLIVGVSGEIQKEAGLVTVIPALQNSVNLPVIGRGLAWLNNTAKVEGKIGMGAEMEFAIVDAENGLTFDSSEGTLSSAISIGLFGGPDSLKVAFEGFGEAKATFQLPANSGNVKSVEATLGANLKVATWLFEKTFTASHTFNYPVVEAAHMQAMLKHDEGFRPISRDFLNRSNYHQNLQATTLSLSTNGIGAAMSTNTFWNVKVSDVFPYTDISLSPHQNAFVFTYFDPAKETLQATEMRYFDSYGIERLWTADSQADLQPSTTHKAAWMRIKDPAFSPDSELEEMATNMEIVWSQWGYQPTDVTDNNHLDFEPQVIASATGDVLFWQSNTGNQMVGTELIPTTINFSTDAGFSAFESVPHAFVDAQEFRYAAANGNLAIAWMQDMDEDLSTLADREVYYMEQVNGAWSLPTRITDNDIPEHFLLLGSDPAGGFHMFWEEADVVARSSGLVTTEVFRCNAGTSIRNLYMARNQHLPEILILSDNGEAIAANLLRYTGSGWTSPLRYTVDFGWEDIDLKGFRRGQQDQYYYFVGLLRDGESTHLVDKSVSLSQSWQGLDLALPDEFVMGDLTPGTTCSIPVQITNISYEDQVNPVIGLYAGEATSINNLMVVTHSGTLAPGESATVTLQWQVPGNAVEVPLVVSRVSSGTSPTGSSFEIPVGLFDLQVQHLQLNEFVDGSAEMVVHLYNDGPYAATNVALNILDGNTWIGTMPLSGLHPGKKAVVRKKIWPRSDFIRAYPLLTVALDETQLPDTNLSNNSASHQVPILPLWKDAIPVGDWLKHDSVGLLYEAADGLTYHADLGWIFVIGETPASLWIYDFASACWWWTGEEAYPWIYEYGLGWIRYSSGGPGNRHFLGK